MQNSCQKLGYGTVQLYLKQIDAMKDIVTHSKGILLREIESYKEDISIINDTLNWIEMKLGDAVSRLENYRQQHSQDNP